MSTIVALFNEKNSAEQARQQLIKMCGLRSDEVKIEENTNTDLTSRLGSLRKMGMPERHGEAYCEGMRRGGALVTAHTDDSSKNVKVQEILQNSGAVNIDQRMNEWQKSGWNHFDSKAKPFDRDEATRERTRYASTAGRDAGSFTIPVIEEDIQVGKRDVETGGIRVREHVSERPVEEEVRLRDENVKVDRKRVDRAVTDADMRNMKDQTIELTEHHEEPVISKQARVKEEIRVSKDATERTERVRDTVKKTDVDIEKMDRRPKGNR